MKRLTACAFAVLFACVASALLAAEAPAAGPPAEEGRYRKLAPGVLEAVDRERKLDETFSRHDIVELLAVDPKFDWAKDVPFRHDTWSLDFKFKVPRMIWVDIPQANGTMQRKLVWYLIYAVTNTGKMMVPAADENLPYETTEGKKVWEVKQSDKPVRFIPRFAFEAHCRYALPDKPSVVHETVSMYKEMVLPLAVAAIQNREDKNRKLLTTPEMCREIAVGETVWGVVTWHDVDAVTEAKPAALYRFSIYIEGLTNAYRWTDKPETLKIEGGINRGRRLLNKTLKLNFWRPGDEYYPHEGEIRYGLPGEVDYEWVYR